LSTGTVVVVVVLVDELVDSGMEVLVDVETTVVVVEVDGGIAGGTTVTCGAVVVGSTGAVDVVWITDVTVGATVVVVVNSTVVVVSTTVVVVVVGSVTGTVVSGTVVVVVVVGSVDVVVDTHVVVVSGTVVVGVRSVVKVYDEPYHASGFPQHTPVRSL
jgi:hypothetical protein